MIRSLFDFVTDKKYFCRLPCDRIVFSAAKEKHEKTETMSISELVKVKGNDLAILKKTIARKNDNRRLAPTAEIESDAAVK